MTAEIVTQIGVAGCAVLGPTFVFFGLRDWWRGRNTPERAAELERIEEIMRKWTGYEPPDDDEDEPAAKKPRAWRAAVQRWLSGGKS